MKKFIAIMVLCAGGLFMADEAKAQGFFSYSTKLGNNGRLTVGSGSPYGGYGYGGYGYASPYVVPSYGFASPYAYPSYGYPAYGYGYAQPYYGSSFSYYGGSRGGYRGGYWR